MLSLRTQSPRPVRYNRPQGRVADVYAALVLAVRDYINKTASPESCSGFRAASIGGRAGDCGDALGRDRALRDAAVRSTPASAWTTRALMAGVQGVRYDEIPIEPGLRGVRGGARDQFKGYPVDASEENPVIRGTILMGISNKTGFLVLTTGNKSEMTTGYATLYGDMAGGFGVLKDCDKELVYDLANWRNTLSRVIPERVITWPRPSCATTRPIRIHCRNTRSSMIMALYINRTFRRRDQGQRPARRRTWVIQCGCCASTRPNAARRWSDRGSRREYGRDWRYPITSGGGSSFRASLPRSLAFGEDHQSPFAWAYSDKVDLVEF